MSVRSHVGLLGADRAKDRSSGELHTGNRSDVGEFVAHDSSPQLGSLNHGSPAKRIAPGPTLVPGLRTGADINRASNLRQNRRKWLLADAVRHHRCLRSWA
jgi:hypothetical protein